MKTAKPIKVLIIDDEWLIRAELHKMLTSFEEVQVIGEAHNTFEAITLLNEIHPDLVFLDISMPGLSGFDLLDRVKVDFDVIFISGYGDKLNQASRYKPIDCLQKPVKQERLVKAVKKFLRNKTNSMINSNEP